MANVQFTPSTEKVRTVLEDGAVLTSSDVVVLIDGTAMGSNLTLPVAGDCVGRTYTFRSVSSSVTLARAASDALYLSSGVAATTIAFSATGEFVVLKPYPGFWVELMRYT